MTFKTFLRILKLGGLVALGARKETWSLSRVSDQVSFFLLLMQNHRSTTQVHEARPPPRFSKKVFQTNCNVAAAGDPRAKLGSYSQAYGTINKTGLDSLLQGRPCNQ